eukprot:TRINITY_DN12435_c0_g1_i1.p4 TRINITY_DN12435_c0_g1~~TRINITY_DN12435_c0_g1_i1.p4  ORF type:complete len:57 (-),score=13.02 TRINITY_DN12435_c0_g1_i1:66-236(-)
MFTLLKKFAPLFSVIQIVAQMDRVDHAPKRSRSELRLIGCSTRKQIPNTTELKSHT